MNLVVDDAIEVKQPTKTDPEESRRSLGMLTSAAPRALIYTLTYCSRPNPPQGRQRCSHPKSMSLMIFLSSPMPRATSVALHLRHRP